MSDILSFNPSRALDGNVEAVPLAKAYFYDTGTLNARTVYADSALSVPHPTPLVADATGVFAGVFVGGGPVRAIIKKPDDTTLHDLDPCVKVPAGGAGASTVSFVPTPEVPASNVQDAIDTVGQAVEAVDQATAAFMDAETTIGQALRSAADALAARTAILTGPQYGTEVTTTSGTEATFSSIPSWAKRITVTFNGVSLSGSNDLLVQIGTGGAATTTGYASTSVATATNGTIAGSTDTAGNIVAVGDSARVVSGVMTLTRTSATGHGWIADHTCRWGVSVISGVGAALTISAALDFIRVKPTGANTFAAGKINVTWE